MQQTKCIGDDRASLPVLLSAKDAEKIGLTRSAFYRLLHREDIPAVIIGGRKYLYRDRFFEWLDKRAGGEVNA